MCNIKSWKVSIFDKSTNGRSPIWYSLSNIRPRALSLNEVSLRGWSLTSLGRDIGVMNVPWYCHPMGYICIYTHPADTSVFTDTPEYTDLKTILVHFCFDFQFINEPLCLNLCFNAHQDLKTHIPSCFYSRPTGTPIFQIFRVSRRSEGS